MRKVERLRLAKMGLEEVAAHISQRKLVLKNGVWVEREPGDEVVAQGPELGDAPGREEEGACVVS